MAEFKVEIKCMWNSETGAFDNFASEEESMQDNDEEDDGDDAEWMNVVINVTFNVQLFNADSRKGYFILVKISNSHCLHLYIKDEVLLWINT